jgi:hypothetical protein
VEGELYDDLCATMSAAEANDPGVCAAGEGIAVNPILVNLVRIWVTKQLKNLACENKDQILAAVQKWIDSYVKNDQIAVVLANVAETVVVTFCGA